MMITHSFYCKLIGVAIVLQIEVFVSCSELVWPLPLFNESQDDLTAPRNVNSAQSDNDFNVTQMINLPEDSRKRKNTSVNATGFHFTVEAFAFVCGIFILAILIVVTIMVCIYCSQYVVVGSKSSVNIQQSRSNDRKRVKRDLEEEGHSTDEEEDILGHHRTATWNEETDSFHATEKKAPLQTKEHRSKGLRRAERSVRKAETREIVLQTGGKETDERERHRTRRGKRKVRVHIRTTDGDRDGESSPESECSSPEISKTLHRQDHYAVESGSSSSGDQNSDLVEILLKAEEKSHPQPAVGMAERGGGVRVKTREEMMKKTTTGQTGQGFSLRGYSKNVESERQDPISCSVCQGCGGIRVS